VLPGGDQGEAHRQRIEQEQRAQARAAHPRPEEKGDERAEGDVQRGDCGDQVDARLPLGEEPGGADPEHFPTLRRGPFDVTEQPRFPSHPGRRGGEGDVGREPEQGERDDPPPQPQEGGMVTDPEHPGEREGDDEV